MLNRFRIAIGFGMCSVPELSTGRFYLRAVYGGPLLQAAPIDTSIKRDREKERARGRSIGVSIVIKIHLPAIHGPASSFPNHLESGVRRVVVVTAADHDDDDEDEEEEEVPMIGGPPGRSSIRERALGRAHNAPG